MPVRPPCPRSSGSLLLVCALAACSGPAPQPGHLFATPPPSYPYAYPSPAPAAASTTTTQSSASAPRSTAPTGGVSSPVSNPSAAARVAAPRPPVNTAAVPPATTTAQPLPAARTTSAAATPALGNGLSAEQRRQLAAIPLPNLPSLAPRESGGVTAVAASPAPSQPDASAPQNTGPGEVRSVATELARASDRIGLGDTQLARIRDAQSLANAGKDSQALVALIQLNQELDSSSTLYVVQHGEALRQIAAKPEVYGNANLWPLIQDANRDTLSDPRRLAEGQKLRVPSFPSAAAAAEAIQRARAALQP